MKKIFLPVVICQLVFLSSCIQSLYPLAANESQVVFKHELLGLWKEDDGTQYFIQSVNDKRYRVRVVDKDHGQDTDTSYLLMTLVLIKDKYFADCYPDTSQPVYQKATKQGSDLILPVHYIFKLNTISEKTIEVGSIDDEQLRKLIQQKKFSIRYEAVEKDRVILLEKAGALRRKFMELEKFPSVYSTEIFHHE